MTGYLLPMDLPRFEAAVRDASSSSAEARWGAAMALGREASEHKQEAVALLARLCLDPQEDVRAQALEGLAEQARQGASIDFELVRSGLSDQSPLVRTAAIEIAAESLDDPISSLELLLEDQEPAVRAAAAASLGDLGASESTSKLALLLDDRSKMVRRAAAFSLAELGDTCATKVLLEALTDRFVAADAAIALGRIRAREAASELEVIAAKWLVQPALRAAAAAALAAMGEPFGRKVALEMLRGRKQASRLAVFAALSELPLPELAGDIGALLDKGDALESSCAIRALLALREVDCAGALQQIEARRGRLGEELDVELAEAAAELQQARAANEVAP